MTATKKILIGTKVVKLKRKIFWATFIQVIVLILAFLAVAWLFFSEVKVEEGTLWSGITKENIWKFAIFLLVIVATYYICGKFLVKKIRNLRHELDKFLSRPQMLKNGGHF